MNGINDLGDNSAKIITDKFTERFLHAYKNLTAKGKSGIIKYSPVLFKRWYYSALVNETTLSPSFIYDACKETASGVSAPSVRPVFSRNRLKGFSFKENEYTLKSHPVVSDLHIVMEFCVPDVDLDSNDKIALPLADKISGFLSLGDPYYLEYLTKIAFMLGLLKKSGAIYSNKAVLSDNYTLFKELYQEESLKKIVKASIKLCSQKINQALPQPLSFVSEKGIESLIKSPVSIDDIYKKIFNSFGVDIERLWDDYNDSKNKGCEHESVLSSTFFLGVILDKWFITPFGEYLKLIEPIYCFCYKFEDELKYLAEVLRADGNIDTALFSPCAFYSFTPFGKLFFAKDTDASKRNVYPSIPIRTLLGLLDSKQEATRRKGLHPVLCEIKESEIKIYRIKARKKDDKNLWCIIDAAEYNTLHEIHIELSLNFGFEFDGYKIYTGETENPFCEFVSPDSKTKHRKADVTILSEFDFEAGKKLLYISGGSIKLELELLETPENRKAQDYPITVKMSKRLKAELEY